MSRGGSEKEWGFDDKSSECGGLAGVLGAGLHFPFSFMQRNARMTAIHRGISLAGYKVAAKHKKTYLTLYKILRYGCSSKP